MLSSAKKKKTSLSTIGFILSAIGSAVGLGNIWGFPTKLMKHGGPAFLIPYFIGILLLGLPLLILEINFGSRWRKSPALFYNRYLGKVGRSFAWYQAALQLLISCYYAVIISWVLSSGIISTFSLSSMAEPTFFEQNIAGEALSGASRWNPFGDMRTIVFIGFIFVIVFTIIIVSSGLSSGIERANKVFVPSLFLILIGLFIYGLTLPGAKTGLYKIFHPDFTKLRNGNAWSAAFGQALFSLSLGVSIMIIYSASAPVGGDNSMRAISIIAGDTLIALVASVVVGSVIGYGLEASSSGGGGVFGSFIETDQGTWVQAGGQAWTNVPGNIQAEGIAYLSDLKTIGGGALTNAAFASGPVAVDPESVRNIVHSRLVFEAFPQVFNTIGNTSRFGFAQILSFFFYVAIFFAAISSMIGLYEPTVAQLQQDYGVKRRNGVLFAAGINFFFGFFFVISSTTATWENVNDGFLVSKLLLLSAILEIFMIAFFWRKLKPILEENNQNSRIKIGRWFQGLLIISGLLTIAVFIYGIYEMAAGKDKPFSDIFAGQTGTDQIKYYVLGFVSFLLPFFFFVFGLGYGHFWMRKLFKKSCNLEVCKECRVVSQVSKEKVIK